jgi:hypothetical protein
VFNHFSINVAKYLHSNYLIIIKRNQTKKLKCRCIYFWRFVNFIGTFTIDSRNLIQLLDSNDPSSFPEYESSSVIKQQNYYLSFFPSFLFNLLTLSLGAAIWDHESLIIFSIGLWNQINIHWPFLSCLTYWPSLWDHL